MHHVIDENTNFSTQAFSSPLFVRFKYINEIYQICLVKLESTKDDHKPIEELPRYLSGTIITNGGTEICVTQKLKEFQGFTRNFFKHIPDAIHDLSHLFKEHSGELHTFDMMGLSKIQNINQPTHQPTHDPL